MDKKARCVYCKKLKLTSAFHKNKNRPSGTTTRCKECRLKTDNRERRLQYYYEHREDHIEKVKEWCKINKDQHAAYSRKWTKNNPDYQKARYHRAKLRKSKDNMNLDIYRNAVYPQVLKWREKRPDENILDAAPKLALYTSCPLLVICHFLGEAEGYSDPLKVLIATLEKFYNVT